MNRIERRFFLLTLALALGAVRPVRAESLTWFNNQLSPNPSWFWEPANWQTPLGVHQAPQSGDSVRFGFGSPNIAYLGGTSVLQPPTGVALESLALGPNITILELDWLGQFGGNPGTIAVGAIRLEPTLTNSGSILTLVHPDGQLGAPSLSLAPTLPGNGNVLYVTDGVLDVSNVSIGANSQAHVFSSGPPTAVTVAQGSLVDVDAGTLEFTRADLEFQFTPGAGETELDLRNGSSATFANGARLLGPGAQIALDGGSSLSLSDAGQFEGATLFPTQTRLEVSAASGAPVVTAQRLGVGSDFFISTPDGYRIGGDIVSAPSQAILDVKNGGSLRIGDNTPVPFLRSDPLLAIGRGGEVRVDLTSSIYIGDPTLPAAFHAGSVVLDDGGAIFGTGRINGQGVTPASPTVLNIGGLLHPGFSPGVLTIAGAYRQDSGTIEFTVGGATPGDGFSALAADAITIGGGTIRFLRAPDYAGDLGAVLTFLLTTGPLSISPGVTIDDETGLGLAFDFETGSAQITQVVPEPPLAALLLVAIAGLASARRRGRSPV